MRSKMKFAVTGEGTQLRWKEIRQIWETSRCWVSNRGKGTVDWERVRAGTRNFCTRLEEFNYQFDGELLKSNYGSWVKCLKDCPWSVFSKELWMSGESINNITGAFLVLENQVRKNKMHEVSYMYLVLDLDVFELIFLNVRVWFKNEYLIPGG